MTKEDIRCGEQLCWKCRHAVPEAVTDARTGGRHYTRGCEWSIYRAPVAGWDAVECEIPAKSGSSDGRMIPSYWIRRCPKFERGRR